VISTTAEEAQRATAGRKKTISCCERQRRRRRRRRRKRRRRLRTLETADSRRPPPPAVAFLHCLLLSSPPPSVIHSIFGYKIGFDRGGAEEVLAESAFIAPAFPLLFSLLIPGNGKSAAPPRANLNSAICNGSPRRSEKLREGEKYLLFTSSFFLPSFALQSVVSFQLLNCLESFERCRRRRTPSPGAHVIGQPLANGSRSSTSSSTMKSRIGR
jgi:hypothetical protein